MNKSFEKKNTGIYSALFLSTPTRCNPDLCCSTITNGNFTKVVQTKSNRVVTDLMLRSSSKNNRSLAPRLKEVEHLANLRGFSTFLHGLSVMGKI